MNIPHIKRLLLEQATPLFGCLAIGLISYAVIPSLGMYYPKVVWHIVAAWILLITALAIIVQQKKYPALEGKYFIPWTITVLIIVFLYLGKTYSPGIYIESDTYLDIFQSLLLVIGALTVGITLLTWERLKWLRLGLFVLAIILFGWMYTRMVHASPSPMIDVFTMLRDGARHTLQGLNPYETPAENPYRNFDVSDLNLRTITFEYPPMSLLPAIVGFGLLGDIRYMGVFCIFFVAFSIWLLARKKNPRTAELLTILWLAQPRGPFVIEQAWTEPWILATLCASILLLRQSRTILGSALFGCFISFKQPFVVTLLQLYRLHLNWKAILALVLTPALIALPYFVWGPRAFLDGAILFMIKNAVTYDSLTFMTYLYREHYILLGSWWTPLVLIASTLLTCTLPHGKRLTTLVFGMSISFFSTFLFGYRGFINYYYFVVALVILSFALMIDENEPSSTPS